MSNSSTPKKALNSTGNSVDVGASPEVLTTPKAIEFAHWLERDGANCTKHLEAAAMLRSLYHLSDYYMRLCDARLKYINELRDDKATLLAALADATTGNSVDVEGTAEDTTTPDDEEDSDSAMTFTRIGLIDNGIDGKDEYLLLERKGVKLTMEYAKDRLTEKYYQRSSQPGGYFCTDFRIMPVQYTDSSVVAIVLHRYDI